MHTEHDKEMLENIDDFSSSQLTQSPKHTQESIEYHNKLELNNREHTLNKHSKIYIERLNILYEQGKKNQHITAKEFEGCISNYQRNNSNSINDIFISSESNKKNIFYYLITAKYDNDLENLFDKLIQNIKSPLLLINNQGTNYMPVEYALAHLRLSYALLLTKTLICFITINESADKDKLRNKDPKEYKSQNEELAIIDAIFAAGNRIDDFGQDNSATEEERIRNKRKQQECCQNYYHSVICCLLDNFKTINTRIKELITTRIIKLIREERVNFSAEYQHSKTSTPLISKIFHLDKNDLDYGIRILFAIYEFSILNNLTSLTSIIIKTFFSNIEELFNRYYVDRFFEATADNFVKYSNNNPNKNILSLFYHIIVSIFNNLEKIDNNVLNKFLIKKIVEFFKTYNLSIYQFYLFTKEYKIVLPYENIIKIIKHEDVYSIISSILFPLALLTQEDDKIPNLLYDYKNDENFISQALLVANKILEEIMIEQHPELYHSYQKSILNLIVIVLESSNQNKKRNNNTDILNTQIIDLINKEKIDITLPLNNKFDTFLHKLASILATNLDERSYCILASIKMEILEKSNKYYNNEGDDTFFSIIGLLKPAFAMHVFKILKEKKLINITHKNTNLNNLLHKILCIKSPNNFQSILDALITLEVLSQQNITQLLLEHNKFEKNPIANVITYYCDNTKSPEKSSSKNIKSIREAIIALIQIYPDICKMSLDKENNTLLRYSLKHHNQLQDLIPNIITLSEIDDNIRKIAQDFEISLDKYLCQAETEKKKQTLPQTYYIPKTDHIELKKKYKELERENERLRDERNKYRKKNEDKDNKLKELEAKLKSYKNDLSKNEKEINHLTQKLTDSIAENNQLKNNINEAIVNIYNLQQQLAAKAEQISMLSEENCQNHTYWKNLREESNKKENEYKKTVYELQNKVSELTNETTTKSKEYNDLIIKINNNDQMYQEEIKQLNIQLNDYLPYKEKHHQILSDNDSLIIKSKEIQEQLTNSIKKYSALKDNFDDFNRDHEEKTKIFNSQIEELEKNLINRVETEKELKAKFLQLEEKYNTLNKDLHDSKESYELLLSQNHQLQAQNHLLEENIESITSSTQAPHILLSSDSDINNKTIHETENYLSPSSPLFFNRPTTQSPKRKFFDDNSNDESSTDSYKRRKLNNCNSVLETSNNTNANSNKELISNLSLNNSSDETNDINSSSYESFEHESDNELAENTSDSEKKTLKSSNIQNKILRSSTNEIAKKGEDFVFELLHKRYKNRFSKVESLSLTSPSKKYAPLWPMFIAENPIPHKKNEGKSIYKKQVELVCRKNAVDNKTHDIKITNFYFNGQEQIKYGEVKSTEKGEKNSIDLSINQLNFLREDYPDKAKITYYLASNVFEPSEARCLKVKNPIISIDLKSYDSNFIKVSAEKSKIITPKYENDSEETEIVLNIDGIKFKKG